ncbi:MAG: HlyD family efflux transporter periplasmic adaptor subunit [Bacteroidales bacterium]|nr:HlyD family efflux transporter periplasmic adaptor subunit [Bacteroidales bacterium]
MNSVKIFALGIIISSFIISCTESDPEAFAYGNFESEDVLISSETTGKILQMSISEGDNLEKGDNIAIIDTTQLHLKSLQLKASRKGVASRLNQLAKQKDVNKVNISILEKEIIRFGSLFLEKAATKKQLDDLEGKLEIILAQDKTIDSQKGTIYAELESIDLQILQLKDQLERSYIKAPFSCSVLEKYAMEEELAAAGRKIVKITDLSYLNLRVFIQGDQLSSVKLGGKVQVIYDGANGLETTSGELIWVSSEAEFTPKIIQTREDRVSLVYAAKIKVKNDGSLKIGMPGEVNIED